MQAGFLPILGVGAGTRVQESGKDIKRSYSPAVQRVRGASEQVFLRPSLRPPSREGCEVERLIRDIPQGVTPLVGRGKSVKPAHRDPSCPTAKVITQISRPLSKKGGGRESTPTAVKPIPRPVSPNPGSTLPQLALMEQGNTALPQLRRNQASFDLSSLVMP